MIFSHRIPALYQRHKPQPHNVQSRLIRHLYTCVAILFLCLLIRPGVLYATPLGSDAFCQVTAAKTGLNKHSDKTTNDSRRAAFARCIQQVNWQAGVDRFVDAHGWIATPEWGISRPLSTANATQFATWRVTNQRTSKQADIVIETGEWAYPLSTSSAQNAPMRGNFLLVWRRDTNQPMQIAFGLLTTDGAAQPSMPPESAIATSSQTVAGRKGDALTLAEIQFGGICGASGMSTAFEVLADNEIFLLRTDGTVRGKARILADPRTKTERWRYIAQSSAIDRANEIAYVFGRYNMSRGDGKTERGYFARVWQSLPNTDANDSANWRVIIDAATPQSRQ